MHTNICLNSSALEGQGGLGILPGSGHWAQRGEVPFWYASSLARISWPRLPDIFRFVLVPFVHLLHLMHDASSEIEFPCPTLRSSDQGYQPEWFNWFRGVPEALSSFQSQVKKSCFFDPIWTKHYCFLQKTFGAFGHGPRNGCIRLQSSAKDSAKPAKHSAQQAHCAQFLFVATLQGNWYAGGDARDQTGFWTIIWSDAPLSGGKVKTSKVSRFTRHSWGYKRYKQSSQK